MTIANDLIQRDRRRMPPPGKLLQDQMHGAFLDFADYLTAIYHRDSRAEEVSRLQNAWSERVPGDGGFLVPEAYRTDLVTQSLEHSIIRPAAQVYTSQTLRLGLPGVDETTHSGSLLGGWIGSWT